MDATVPAMSGNRARDFDRRCHAICEGVASHRWFCVAGVRRVRLRAFGRARFNSTRPSLEPERPPPEHPFTATSNSSFTDTTPSHVAADLIDGAGNVTNRVWKDGANVVRTQNLFWDGRGR